MVLIKKYECKGEKSHRLRRFSQIKAYAKPSRPVRKKILNPEKDNQYTPLLHHDKK